MDNMDDSETVAKISDSAYSNSCSNSQSRRSHSSKSTHSGSHSSGSSGYGGKPSTSGSSTNLNQQLEKRTKEKDAKKKKTVEATTEDLKEKECHFVEPATETESPKEGKQPALQVDAPPLMPVQTEECQERMDDMPAIERKTLQEEQISCNAQSTSLNLAISRLTPSYCNEGFSFVISLHDGVIMFSTSTLTSTLGFPMDLWIGRSFIDFVHPRDRSSFSSEITNGFGLQKNADGTPHNVCAPATTLSIMLCRLRVYKGLSDNFGVKESNASYMAFHLKLSFKQINFNKEDITYVVVHATPFISAFKTPNELVEKPIPFVLRHSANGRLEYIDPESVPYLGYLPQDLLEKDALELYHPDDMSYLKQIYEQIVKQGGSNRSKTYRMLAQNGDYLKLESEWSSFINPWSRKLEFVIGKHHVVEGPNNPEVFQSPSDDKQLKLSDEDKKKWKACTESIIKIMNEVLTKPADVAKQQMTKRCQDLAVFMDGLIEDNEVSKRNEADEELRVEIQDPDHYNYERDSVMLGGISPHHEYSDSKSSTDTPLSYNHLNYNENLQRYFDSHDPNSYENYCAIPALTDEPRPQRGVCFSPMAQNSGKSSCSGDSNFVMSTGCPGSPKDYLHIKLTETLLCKHNIEMEKDLVKKQRDTRQNKGDRENVYNTRQKKKEHIARCNATFQPTKLSVEPQLNVNPFQQPHGLKRHSKPGIEGTESTHKHHCPAQRQPRKIVASSAMDMNTPVATTSTAPVQLQAYPLNSYLLGFGSPQQMSMMNPVAGMVPMYYVPAGVPVPPPPATTTTGIRDPNSYEIRPPMHYVLCGHVYGPPMVYSPMNDKVGHPMQRNDTSPLQQNSTINPLGLASSNYDDACKTSLPSKPKKLPCVWLKKTRLEVEAHYSEFGAGSLPPNRPYAIPRSTGDSKTNSMKMATSSENMDKTDDSSYSSFYSSFFKTDSGSAEDSSDVKKSDDFMKNAASTEKTIPKDFVRSKPVKVVRRKMDPPWLEQVSMTSDFINKYQIPPKNMDDVLNEDKLKFGLLEQSTLVNDQLSQLYMDLQLEGRDMRLTLEEGITSSSSSGEETSSTFRAKGVRKRREYSRLGMIYEENAPLPPPPDVTDGKRSSPKPSSSKDF